MARHGSLALIVIGFLLILDSFITIQNMFTGATISFVNMFELLMGLIVLFIGMWIRTKKV